MNHNAIAMKKIIALQPKSLTLQQTARLQELGRIVIKLEKSMSKIIEIIKRQGISQGRLTAQSEIEQLTDALKKTFLAYFKVIYDLRIHFKPETEPIVSPTEPTCNELARIIVKTMIRFHTNKLQLKNTLRNNSYKIKQDSVAHKNTLTPMFKLETFSEKIRYAHRYPSLLYLLRTALKARAKESANYLPKSPLKDFLTTLKHISIENTPEFWAQYLQCYRNHRQMEEIFQEYEKLVDRSCLLAEEKKLLRQIDSSAPLFSVNDRLFSAFTLENDPDPLKSSFEQFCEQCQTDSVREASQFLATSCQKLNQTEELQDLIYHFKGFLLKFIPKSVFVMLKNGYQLAGAKKTEQAHQLFTTIRQKAHSPSKPPFHFIRLGELEEYRQLKASHEPSGFQWIPFKIKPPQPIPLQSTPSIKIMKTLTRCIQNSTKKQILQNELDQLSKTPSALNDLFRFILNNRLLTNPKYILILTHAASLSLHWKERGIPQVLKDQLDLNWVLQHTLSVFNIKFYNLEDEFKTVGHFIAQYNRLKNDEPLDYKPRHPVIWKWCAFHVDNSMREFLKKIIDTHTRNKLTNIKVLSIILNVLLDDLADRFQNELAFTTLAECLLQTPRMREFLKSKKKFDLEAFITTIKAANQADIATRLNENPTELERFRGYFDLALQLWAKHLELLISTVGADNFAALEEQYYTDYGRMICSMVYSLRINQHIIDPMKKFRIQGISRFLAWNMNMGQFETIDLMAFRNNINKTAYENYRYGNNGHHPDYRSLLPDESVKLLSELLPKQLHQFLGFDPTSKNFRRNYGSTDYGSTDYWNHRLAFLLTEQHMGQTGNDAATYERELDEFDFSNEIFLITMEKIPNSLFYFLLLSLHRNQNTAEAQEEKQRILKAIHDIDADVLLLQNWFEKYKNLQQLATNPTFHALNVLYKPDKTLQQVVVATASYLIFKGRL